MRNRTVTAMDIGICRLAIALDTLFIGLPGEYKPWQAIAGRGLDIILADKYQGDKRQQSIQFRPSVWPKMSIITCRFIFSQEFGWSPYEGYLSAPHIPFKLSFRFREHWLPHIEPRESNTPESQILAQRIRIVFGHRYGEQAARHTPGS